jgi:hypothetical protein
MPSVEIMIKGQDLISAKGYFQSNRGRWRTSGRLTMLDWAAATRCSWRGQSSPELRATRLWYFIFGGFSSYGTGRVRGTHQGGLQPVGSSKAGHATASLKLRPSTMVAGSSKGWLTTRLGKTGVAHVVEHRRQVDGAQEASHAAWRWNGWT